MALLPQERSLPRESRAAEAPAPGFLDAIGASFRVGWRDVPGSDIDEERGSYKPIVDALTAANGKPWTIYVDPHSGQSDADGIWRDVAAMRARRPDFLAELGTREQWEQSEEKRLTTLRAQDRADEEKSGMAPWLIGKVGAAAIDPFNLGSMMIGGPATSIGRLAIREAAINALTEAAETPVIAYQRAQRGEELTAGEAAGNIAGAALLGAALPAGARLASDYVITPIGEAARSALYPRLPQAWQDRIAARMTLPDVAEGEIGRANLTLDERAAADVLRREVEIDAASPFVPDGAGAAAHRDLLGEALRAIAADAPSATLKARARASSAMRPIATAADAGTVDRVFDALIMQESGGRAGISGLPTPYGIARGLTQVLDATGADMARKLGIPWRPELMRATSAEGADYQRRIGRAYFEEGLAKYGGDIRKALAYYHGGPDQRKWGPKTRAYVEDVLARLDTDIPRIVDGAGDAGDVLARADAELGEALRARDDAAAEIGEDGARAADRVEAREAPIDTLRRNVASVEAGELPPFFAEQIRRVREGPNAAHADQAERDMFETMQRFLPEMIAQRDAIEAMPPDMARLMDPTNVLLNDDQTLRGYWVRDFKGNSLQWDPATGMAEYRRANLRRETHGQVRDMDRDAFVAAARPMLQDDADIEFSFAASDPAQSMRDLWANQRARGAKPSPVYVAKAADGTVKGWSLSRADAARRFGGDEAVTIARQKPPAARVPANGFDDPQGDLFAARTAESFSDPRGPAIEAQRASLEHDARAVLHGRALDSTGGEAALPAATYRLSEDGPEVTVQQLVEEIDAEEAAIAAVRGCL
jgi:hypothetical protein